MKYKVGDVLLSANRKEVRIILERKDNQYFYKLKNLLSKKGSVYNVPFTTFENCSDIKIGTLGEVLFLA